MSFEKLTSADNKLSRRDYNYLVEAARQSDNIDFIGGDTETVGNKVVSFDPQPELGLWAKVTGQDFSHRVCDPAYLWQEHTPTENKFVAQTEGIRASYYQGGQWNNILREANSGSLTSGNIYWIYPGYLRWATDGNPDHIHITTNPNIGVLWKTTDPVSDTTGTLANLTGNTLTGLTVGPGLMGWTGTNDPKNLQIGLSQRITAKGSGADVTFTGICHHTLAFNTGQFSGEQIDPCTVRISYIGPSGSGSLMTISAVSGSIPQTEECGNYCALSYSSGVTNNLKFLPPFYVDSGLCNETEQMTIGLVKRTTNKDFPYDGKVVLDQRQSFVTVESSTQLSYTCSRWWSLYNVSGLEMTFNCYGLLVSLTGSDTPRTSKRRFFLPQGCETSINPSDW